MIINGTVINTIEELELAIVDMDTTSKEAMRAFFNGVDPVVPTTTPLRIRQLDLIHDNFKGLEDSKIDFTTHLKNGITLIKKYTIAANGRPIKSKYYYPTVSLENLICEIKFDFVNNSMGFMTRRTESLGYYSITGVVPEYHVISDRFYDFADITEASISVRERSEARSNIMNEIKTFLNGFLMQYYIATGKTYIDVMNDGGTFWKNYLAEINSWIETASIDFKNKLLADTTTTILDIQISVGVTVRDYIISRITY